MIKKYYGYKINTFLKLSIVVIMIGNFWFMPLAIIEPFVLVENFPAWVIAAIPIAYRSAGMFSPLFKGFSIIFNNVLLILLDLLYLLVIVYFYYTKDVNGYIVAGVVIGFLSSVIGEQWSNQFKDYVTQVYPKENKDYLDARSVWIGAMCLIFSLVNLIPAKFVGKGDYNVVLIYVTVLGVLALCYQVFYFIKLKKEISSHTKVEG